jgi:hypothetical protein
MRTIENISITARARTALSREFAKASPRAGEVTAMVYVTTFTNPDGTTVSGFVPCYMVGPVAGGSFGDMWAVAHLPALAPLIFMPNFEWHADERYVVDLASPTYALFTIGPA